MNYYNMRGKGLIVVGLAVLSLPGSLYGGGYFDSPYMRYGLMPVGLGVAFLGTYKYGCNQGEVQYQKTIKADVLAADAKVVVDLASIKLGLDVLDQVQDLEKYARGVYGTIQPVGTLQKELKNRETELLALKGMVKSEEQDKQHKEIFDLLCKVRIRVGQLNPVVFDGEAKAAIALAKERELAAAVVQQLKKLQEQEREDRRKMYAVAQVALETKTEANQAWMQTLANAEERARKQDELVEASLKMCKTLPDVIRDHTSSVISTINDRSREINVHADQVIATVEGVSTQVAVTEKEINGQIANAATGLHDALAAVKSQAHKDEETLLRKLAENKAENVVLIDKLANGAAKEAADIESIKNSISSINQKLASTTVTTAEGANQGQF